MFPNLHPHPPVRGSEPKQCWWQELLVCWPSVTGGRWQQGMLHEDALSRQKWKSNCSFMMCWALLGVCHAAPDRATSVPFSSTACLIIPPAQQWEKDGIHKPCTSPFLGSTKPLDPRAGREPTRQQDDVPAFPTLAGNSKPCLPPLPALSAAPLPFWHGLEDPRTPILGMRGHSNSSSTHEGSSRAALLPA